eukprot:TRINITY_DN93270_c0_g1_i1.p1 TRINITY_DN93270_c0_g1~~TRINITY_DN93270_c0_g1_i1.p1  ORF type:complete len:526 (+),score=59.92 TRINITY_DN93270_c0_g1_i1:34-1578(+)
MEHREAGNAHFRAARFSDAVLEYEAAVANTSSSDITELAALFCNLSAAHLALHNCAQAIEYADKCLILQPQNPKALFRKAKALLGLNEPLAALLHTVRHAGQSEDFRRLITACYGSLQVRDLDPRVAVQETSSDNFALVALADIPEHTVLLREPPAIAAVSGDISVFTNGVLDPEAILHDLRGLYPREINSEYLTSREHLATVLRYNAFAGGHVFRLGSMANHSCYPNSRRQIDPTSGWLSLTTVRPVTSSEALALNYLPGDVLCLGVAHRRAFLAEHYGFVCMCSRCERDSTALGGDGSEFVRCPSDFCNNYFHYILGAGPLEDSGHGEAACPHCRQNLSLAHTLEEYQAVFAAAVALSEKHEKAPDPLEAIDVLHGLLRRIERVVHPSHHMVRYLLFAITCHTDRYFDDTYRDLRTSGRLSPQDSQFSAFFTSLEMLLGEVRALWALQKTFLAPSLAQNVHSLIARILALYVCLDSTPRELDAEGTMQLLREHLTFADSLTQQRLQSLTSPN